MQKPLTVLFTNITMEGRSGTVIVTRNHALELMRRGHRPIVYSPQPGEVADELRRRSVPVVSDIGAIGTVPDVIHGHHNTTTVTAIARFPGVPAIFWCHDFVSFYDIPPLLPAIRRYVAVDETVYDRMIAESGVPPERARVILNAVDLEKFRPWRQLSERPKRVLCYVKHAEPMEAIRQACAMSGIELEFAGVGAGRLISSPEELLPNYDLVFASALGAIEAMAAGAAVIVCDGRGLAGLVTAERVEAWRQLNFGLRTLTREVTAEALAHEIEAYDRNDAAEVTRRIRASADLRRAVDEIIEIYVQVIEENRAAPASAEGEAAASAMAAYLERWLPQMPPRWPRQALEQIANMSANSRRG